MTQQDVWQAAMDRLLSPSSVATYARTWGLTEAEARRALVSGDQPPCLVVPCGFLYLDGHRVMLDLLDGGNLIEVTTMAEFNFLHTNLAARPGVSATNLAARYNLGLLLGWQRRVDVEELDGQQLTQSYLYHPRLQWSVGWTRPVVGHLLPPWEYDVLSLTYLVRWLHLVGWLRTPYVHCRLLGLPDKPAWFVEISRYKFYTVPISEWTLTGHQAITRALTWYLTDTRHESYLPAVETIPPPLLHDTWPGDDYQQLAAAWRDELHRTYLVSDEQHDSIAFEYYQQTRGDT